MSWAQRLKRLFYSDIDTCRECGGAVREMACIEDPAVIDKTLTPLNEKAVALRIDLPLQVRARPQAELFG